MKLNVDVVMALVAAVLVIVMVFVPVSMLVWKDALAYQPKEIACPK